ncbi:hypothetical protein T310_0580 [Rasamsonia emersonii CBS 393.64]|uniref:Uncharacterized protein n=1 Tax=Rasamsonia emersonii (strain ATCC 16479 / CBS 393.64 / IMI 116815) TaxID=1408163 RepID=A0A0F4Z4F6_RASE3|nr:hypothetical protein T310_0580 [Rasamsonia emersonii CBS 393.64]KKA25402.1 hypothetical protein T310_0580 [Rasamsonia emersonii CBS 393.64]
MCISTSVNPIHQLSEAHHATHSTQSNISLFSTLRTISAASVACSLEFGDLLRRGWTLVKNVTGAISIERVQIVANKAILVIVDQHEDPKTGAQQRHYRLSGINTVQGRWDQTLQVPGDKHQVSPSGHKAGYPGKTTTDTVTLYRATYWGNQHQDVYPHGYTIYARCWELIERVVFRNCRNGSQSMAYRRFVADPVDIPELKDLIVKSSKRPQRKRNHRHNNKALVCSRDVENAIQAFGWTIPDYYWQIRTPPFIFEVKPLDSTTMPFFDWQSFALGVEELLETSLGLQNRRRIFRILQGTKKAFHVALREKFEY